MRLFLYLVYSICVRVATVSYYIRPCFGEAAAFILGSAWRLLIKSLNLPYNQSLLNLPEKYSEGTAIIIRNIRGVPRLG